SVFSSDYALSTDGSNIRQRLYVYNNSIPTTQLRNVVVIANFSVGNQNINPSFPTDAYSYPMTWYNLMDNTPVTITSPTATITLAPGQFRVYGNKPSTLSSNELELIKNNIDVYPNPTRNSFALSADVNQVEIYSITGQLIKSFNNVISNQQLDITNLETGMYLIKIIDANGANQSKKLI
ncbi:MAG: T9SS type A sorting domain-containing protein, partial [Bacteroidia bacterium]